MEQLSGRLGLPGVERAADLVLGLTTRYRQPETTRAADHLARAELHHLPPARP